MEKHAGGKDEDEHDGGHGGGMASRGVTRPRHGGGGDMDAERRMEMLRMHHRQTLWIPWTLLLLGLWMMAAPWALGHGNPAQWVQPSGGRGVWFGDQPHTALRAWLMTWSDLVSGLLLVVFGWRALRPDRPVSWWICCFTGIWLSLAPLVFWAPTAAAYLNDTVVGALVIALAVLVPGMPNMIRYMRMGGATPPGWSYNPSSWPQRAVLIALAFAGWLVSRQLAAFQLGYTQAAWDPFFADGTRTVLNSRISHQWPVSDAALGTFAYTLEFLMGWMGGPARWRTMPWMVAFFGILVIPLGLVHVALVISQPVVVGAWCTLCLLAAALMLPMIPLQVDEVVAMGQNLVHARGRGESVWRAFWKGGPADEATEDERSPEMMELPEKPRAVAAASLWGTGAPWTLVACTALGVWIMLVPGLLGIHGRAANVAHLGGALVVVTAVIAMGEPVRAFRWLALPLGLAVAVLVWVMPGASTAGAAAVTVAGVLAAALALPRGAVHERFGAWDPLVR